VGRQVRALRLRAVNVAVPVATAARRLAHRATRLLVVTMTGRISIPALRDRYQTLNLPHNKV
jgi:hypothetical protein